ICMKAVEAIGDAVQGAMTRIVDGVSQASDRAKGMERLASRLGTSAGALGGLEFAGARSGAGAGEMATALDWYNRTLGDAMRGNEQAIKSFEALGLNFKDLSKMDAVDAFAKIAETIRALPSPAERASAAMDMFGRGAHGIQGVLNRSRAEMAAMADEAKRLNVVMSPKAADAVASLGGAFKGVGAATEGSWNAIAEAIAPVITDFMKSLDPLLPTMVNMAKASAEVLAGFIQVGADELRMAGLALQQAACILGVNMTKIDTSWIAERKSRSEAALGEVAARKKAIAQSSGDENPLFKAALARGIAKGDETQKQQKAFDEKVRIGAEQSSLANKAQGQSLYEQTRTPFEKFAVEMDRIGALFQTGAIDMDTMNRAKNTTEREYIKQNITPDAMKPEFSAVGSYSGFGGGNMAASGVFASQLVVQRDILVGINKLVNQGPAVAVMGE
ncbi:MAG: hypothetical protein NTW87_14320, partial [Planctomycetota bacterium]|nr:hypothetical protein [Planctomycetota bacterium]